MARPSVDSGPRAAAGAWPLRRAGPPAASRRRWSAPAARRTWAAFAADWNRPDAICPGCGAHERHRALWLYLRDGSGLGQGPHVTSCCTSPPSTGSAGCSGPCRAVRLRHRRPGSGAGSTCRPTSPRCRSRPPPSTRCCAATCSSTCEDDRAAMSEIARVLRPGGWAARARSRSTLGRGDDLRGSGHHTPGRPRARVPGNTTTCACTRSTSPTGWREAGPGGAARSGWSRACRPARRDGTGSMPDETIFHCTRPPSLSDMSLATLPLRGPVRALDAAAWETLETRIDAGAGARPSRRHPRGGLGVRAGRRHRSTSPPPSSRRGAPTTASSASSSPGCDGHAVCGLGRRRHCRRADGPDRFARAALGLPRPGLAHVGRRPRRGSRRPPGAGPCSLGGFAFAPAGGSAPEWAGFAPAQLVLPEVVLRAARDEARLTVTRGRRGRRGARRRCSSERRRRVRELQPGGDAAADPHPVARPRVAGAAPPAHFEEAVRRAVERIRAGELDKVVLAREVRVHRPGADRPRARARRAARGLRGLLLLLRRRAGGRVRGRQPGAAGAPRRRAGPDRGAGGHDPPQRRPRGGRPPGRAAAPEPQEPRGAGHRHAADPSARSIP